MCSTPRSSWRPPTPTTRSSRALHCCGRRSLCGAVLVALVPGERRVVIVPYGGGERIRIALVAGRWTSTFGHVWDLLMLWQARLHCANGLRNIINDFAERD